MKPTEGNWEEEFDRKFPWLSNLKVTHYFEEDYEKAKLLEKVVNSANKDIKDFIKHLEEEAYKRGLREGTDAFTKAMDEECKRMK